MKTEQTIITTHDGYSLGITLREPETGIKGVVQINSGTGIPQYLYSNLASFLTENGFVTVTYDYRGIGNSKPKSLRGFQASTSDWGKYDMVSVLDWLHQKYPNERKLVVGHSMGGQLLGLMNNQHLVEKFILIASSTGYWKDMNGVLKWSFPLILYGYMPFSVKLNGFARAKKIRQGEDLPKDVALQWRNWCINPNYFTEYLNQLEENYYQKITQPIHAVYFTDDPIANDITVGKILNYYQNATITKKRIAPKNIGVSKIGHMGFFSRRFKETLWKDLLNQLN